jgi:hypothetical protein
MTLIRFQLFILTFIPLVAAAQDLSTGEPQEGIALVPTKITIRTIPTGLTVTVDGTSHVTPYNTNWTSGSSHTINTASPQSGGTSTRYVFSSWSDGGAQSHTVITPGTSTTYTATFETQYYLTMTANPSGGGTVSPTSGWRGSGQTVGINATAGNGYNFSSWSGSGTGSYSGTTKSTSITMNGPITEAAQFAVIQPILSVTPTDRSVTSEAGFTTFAVINVGSGTMNWTASSDQTWATITDGGSGTNNGVITVTYTANPVSVDSVRVATIVVAAPGATGSPQYVTVTQSPASVISLIVDTTSVSDDFFGTVLDNGLWTFVNPLSDAILSVGNKELSIAVPGGIKHEAWTSGNSAPKVMQTVAPSMNVNNWTVRFNSLPSGSATSIPMEGLFFEQDALNYVRVDIFSDGASVYVFGAGFLDGPTSATPYFNVPIPATSAPVWVNVTRTGSLWRVYISLDGATSFLAGSFEHLMSVQKVGPYAGNAGDAPEPFICLVDYFQGALPAKPNLAKPDSGVSDVVRPIIFAWDSATAADSYRIQVATDQSFGTVLVDSQIVGTSVTIDSLGQSAPYYWWRVEGRNNMGWGEFSQARPFSLSTTSVAPGSEIPLRFALQQNYPNPFNPTTRIRYTIAGSGGLGLGSRNTGAGEAGAGVSGLGASTTKIVVYDLLGREVAVLVNEKKAPGTYEVSFDARGLASGLYIYRLTAGSFIQSMKMLVMK